MKGELFRTELDYDSKFDQLSIRRPGFSTTFSLEAGNLVMDFTSKEFVGIEVQDATRWLSDLFGAKLNPDKIKAARIGFQDKSNFVKILVVIQMEGRQMEKEVIVQKFEPVPIPA